jgi:formylmethanofuran dehydrogenase subunit D
MPKLDIIVLTGRTIEQGKGKEMGKLSKVYLDDVVQCRLDPDDMKALKLRENDNIKVTTDYGSVVLKAVESLRAPHPKMIFISYGPWASMISDPRTNGTGMPSLKGIPGTVEPAPNEKVLSMLELVNQLKMED